MTVPPQLIEFFQQEATEYLERLDQLLAQADHSVPDPASFVAQTRALRGSAMMTRLDGLTELAATLERIAGGLRGGELLWDQRLHFAVRGALAELRSLIALAPSWSDAEQRRGRTQAVALAAVAAGYLARESAQSLSVGGPVVPISRFVVTDGGPAIVHRNPKPTITIARRFRGDMAASSDVVARECLSLSVAPPGTDHPTVEDGLRRALLGLADVADSYGATSISTLASKMARATLDGERPRGQVVSFSRLLMDRELTDNELAAQVRSAATAWDASERPDEIAKSAPVTAAAPDTGSTEVPIKSLLFSGTGAIRESVRVCGLLNEAIARDSSTPLHVRELADELSDLLHLAGPM